MSNDIKILHLEDSLEDSELIERELRNGGITFSLIRVYTENKFIDALNNFKPDIILADYQLPSFNGLMALKIVHESSPNTPFIIVSGHIGEEHAIEAIKNGVTDYIIKGKLTRLCFVVEQSIEDSKRRVELRRIHNDLKLKSDALESSINAITFSDINGTVTFVNSAAVSMWRYENSNEIIGKSVVDFWKSEELSKIVMKSIIETGHFEGDLTAKKADGTVFDVHILANTIIDYDDNIVGTMASFIDITEENINKQRIVNHIKLLEILREIEISSSNIDSTKELLDFICDKLILIKSFDTIWAVYKDESEEEQISYSGNSSFQHEDKMSHFDAKHNCHILNYFENIDWDKDYIVIENYHDICKECPLHLDHGDSGTIGLKLSHKDIYYGYIVIIGKSERVSLKYEQLLFIELARHISNMIYTSDIKNRNKEMEELRNNLHEVKRLETLGRLAGGMAHDFNNQLTAIIGNSEFLQMELEGNEELLESVNDIIVAADISTDLARDVLNFSRERGDDFKPFNICEMVNHSEKLINRSLPKLIRISASCTLKNPDIMAIEHKIENALLNLAINGADAMGGEGELRIICEDTTISYKDKVSKLFDILPGDYIKLSVINSGSGISDDLAKKIFTPFFTTKEEGKGTGLGLPSVISTAKEHGGAVDFVNLPTGGVQFSIYIPQNPTQISEIENTELKIIEGTGNIIVVDDDVRLCNILIKFLSRIGYKVKTFSSPTNALDEIGKNNSDIDLIISDIDMPEMNGINFYHEVQKVVQNLHIMFVTGHNPLELSDFYTEKNDITIVQKPYKFAEISKIIAKNIR